MASASSLEFIVALVTPFTRGGRSVEWRWLERLVEKLLSTGGLTGFWVNGTTGEWHSLSLEERKRILETVVERTKARHRIIQGVQDLRVEDAIELARHARETGADAIFSLPPSFHTATPDALTRYYRDLSKAFEGPVFIYLNSHVQRQLPSAQTVASLHQQGYVEGAKLTTHDLSYAESLSYHIDDLAESGFTLLAGSETLLPSLVPLGASGVVSALANLAPLLPPSIADAMYEAKWTRLARLMSNTLLVRRLISGETGFIPGLKKALSLRCRRFPPYVRLPYTLATRVSDPRDAVEALRGFLVKC